MGNRSSRSHALSLRVDSGLLSLRPEVGDEVQVAFVNGDLPRPGNALYRPFLPQIRLPLRKIPRSVESGAVFAIPAQCLECPANQARDQCRHHRGLCSAVLAIRLPVPCLECPGDQVRDQCCHHRGLCWAGPLASRPNRAISSISPMPSEFLTVVVTAKMHRGRGTARCGVGARAARQDQARVSRDSSTPGLACLSTNP